MAQAYDALRLTLRLDVGGRATLGPGKIRLLELIRQHGSISAAGRAMGMSYRRAWALVESLNATFTEPLVATRPAGRAAAARTCCRWETKSCACIVTWRPAPSRTARARYAGCNRSCARRVVPNPKS